MRGLDNKMFISIVSFIAFVLGLTALVSYGLTAKTWNMCSDILMVMTVVVPYHVLVSAIR